MVVVVIATASCSDERKRKRDTDDDDDGSSRRSTASASAESSSSAATGDPKNYEELLVAISSKTKKSIHVSTLSARAIRCWMGNVSPDAPDFESRLLSELTERGFRVEVGKDSWSLRGRPALPPSCPVRTRGSFKIEAGVIVERDRDLAVLPSSVLDPASSSSADAGRARLKDVPADVIAGVRSVGPNEYKLSKKTAEYIRKEGLERAARSMRLGPRSKLRGLKADGLGAAMGFRNGDIVLEVNGIEVGDPDGALDAYSSIRTAKSGSVKVERDGAPVVLRYTEEP